ncbi:MAG TPA: YcxB family protein [Caulobacteraceae bacterium]|jgi:hypothetical protein|nr:YcxB family protein [Caulobacteraceae bacterium]
MARIETQIRVGEAARAGMAVARRQGTAGWTNYAVWAALGLGIAALTIILTRAVGGSGLPLFQRLLLDLVFGLALLFGLGFPAVRWFQQVRYKRWLAGRGVRGPLAVSYEVTDSAFVYAIGGISRIVRWDVVFEMFRAREWWVLLAQGEAYYIPSRAFGDLAAEREFIHSVLDHLAADARQRSSDALSFASG